MPKKNIHVTHRKDGAWAVKGEGDKRASSLHKTHLSDDFLKKSFLFP